MSKKLSWAPRFFYTRLVYYIFIYIYTHVKQNILYIYIYINNIYIYIYRFSNGWDFPREISNGWDFPTAGIFQRLGYTRDLINAEIFQRLGPKRRESCNGGPPPGGPGPDRSDVPLLSLCLVNAIMITSYYDSCYYICYDYCYYYHYYYD